MDVAEIPELLAYIDKEVPRNIRQTLRQILISRWAETDLQGALAYIQTISNKQEHDQALTAFVAGWAGKDPAAAAAWVKQFPGRTLRSQLISQVSAMLAAMDPQAALDMAGGESQQPLRKRDVWHLYFLGQQDPDEAAAKAADVERTATHRRRFKQSPPHGRNMTRKPRSLGRTV